MPVRIPITIMLSDDPDQIGDAVNALAVINAGEMRRAIARGKPLPSLASGSIRYARERPGREWWQTASDVARRGMGDCEDLAAYYVAEARLVHGIEAEAFASFVRPGLVHIRVRLPSGDVIDPSAMLGMRGAG